MFCKIHNVRCAFWKSTHSFVFSYASVTMYQNVLVLHTYYVSVTVTLTLHMSLHYFAVSVKGASVVDVASSQFMKGVVASSTFYKRWFQRIKHSVDVWH